MDRNPFDDLMQPPAPPVAPAAPAPAAPNNPFEGVMAGQPVRQAIGGDLGAAGRFVTSALSPLQAPQDLAFATVGGLLNPYRSPMDYYRDIEWAHYSPFNRAPNRPVDGRTLARLAGVQDETANQWLGLGLDFLADPLMGGMMLRAVGKMAKAPGLMRAADAMDTLAESTMLVGGVPTARVVSAARGLPGFRQFESAVASSFAGKYLNHQVTRAVAWAERTTVPVRPLSGREFSVSGMFAVDAGRVPGAQDALSRIGGAAAEVSDNTAALLMQAMAEAGDRRWIEWANRHQRSMTVMYDLPVQTINDFSPITSRSIMNQAYSAAEELGYVQMRARGAVGVRSEAINPVRSPMVDDAAREIDSIERILATAPTTRATQRDLARRTSRFEASRDIVMDAARAGGDDPVAAVNAFDSVVEKFQQASALEGYFASGVPILHGVFLENMAAKLSALSATSPGVAAAVRQAGGEARVTAEAWRNLVRAGANGKAAAALDQPIAFAGSNLIKPAQRGTYRSMFGEYADLPALNLGTYFDNLTTGHMRRSFGMFQDDDSWRLAVSAMEEGRVVPVRTVNENQLIDAVRQQGFGPESDAAEAYLRAVTPPVNPKRATGGFVHEADLAKHMREQGIPADRIESFWEALGRQADPHVADLADRMRQYGALNIGDNVRPGVSDATFRGAAGTLGTRRQNLGQDDLDVLIEMMDPILSRTQTAVATNRAFRRQEGLASLYELAKKQGLVVHSSDPSAASLPRYWKAVSKNDADVFPLLEGHYVHPTLLREFRNVATSGRNPNSVSTAIANLRSIVTAGYLANPATTTANVVGGFWTAALYGVNPRKLASNMAEVYRDWKREGRHLEDLRNMRDIVQNGAAHTELIRLGQDIPTEFLGTRAGVDAISSALGEAGRRYQEFLRRPAGKHSGWLGLGVFEASEALFRLGTYRMVLKETGSVQEARKMARFVVFDYAAQPGAVQLLRDTGVFLFPSFPYFMFGRTLNAAVKNPATLALGDRTAELIWNMQVQDEDTRTAMLGGMDEWMKDDKFVPVRRKPNGDMSMLPLNQLLPTNTLTGAPFADSLTSLGLIGPVLDMFTAVVGLAQRSGEGDDPGSGRFTGQYGRRTLPTGVTSFEDDPGAVVQGLASFAWNSFAPGFMRKAIRLPEDTDQLPTGLVPNLVRSLQPAPAEWANSGRTARELATRRADQDVWDSLISATLRSTRNIATEGPLANISTILSRAEAQLQRELNQLDNDIALMQAEGRAARAATLEARRARAVERFRERWGPIIQEFVRMRDVERRFEPPGGY